MDVFNCLIHMFVVLSNRNIVESRQHFHDIELFMCDIDIRRELVRVMKMTF